MRKALVVIVSAVVITCGAPVYNAYAGDNILDKTGDVIATIGKKGAEKDAAKAERRAKRDAKRAEKAARKEAKKAAKDIDKAGDKLEKKVKANFNN